MIRFHVSRVKKASTQLQLLNLRQIGEGRLPSIWIEIREGCKG